jgi:hypothetical protein
VRDAPLPPAREAGFFLLLRTDSLALLFVTGDGDEEQKCDGHDPDPGHDFAVAGREEWLAISTRVRRPHATNAESAPRPMVIGND